MGDDTWRLERQPRAWRKVMAAYRRVYGFGHLRVDCRGPRSAPELYAPFEYGTTFIMHAMYRRILASGAPKAGLRVEHRTKTNLIPMSKKGHLILAHNFAKR